MSQKRRIVNDPLRDSRGTDPVLILDGGLHAYRPCEEIGVPIDFPKQLDDDSFIAFSASISAQPCCGLHSI